MKRSILYTLCGYKCKDICAHGQSITKSIEMLSNSSLKYLWVTA